MYVLLGPISTEFLPLMWMRCFFIRACSLVRVMFSESASLETLPQQKMTTLSSTKKSLRRDNLTPPVSHVDNFELLSSEFVSLSGELPLDVMVACKSSDDSWYVAFVKSSHRHKAEQLSSEKWPSAWHQIKMNLDEQSSFTSSKKMRNIGHITHNTSNDDNCHVAMVTNAISLIVIRGHESGKRRKVSDDDIERFIETSLPFLRPGNLFSVEGILSAKSLMATNAQDALPLRNLTHLKHHSLWDELQWSENKVLTALGLRKSSSPIIAPLKSPYIKQLRRRRKRIKSTMNHGHIALFLGDLSQVM